MTTLGKLSVMLMPDGSGKLMLLDEYSKTISPLWLDIWEMGTSEGVVESHL